MGLHEVKTLSYSRYKTKKQQTKNRVGKKNSLHNGNKIFPTICQVQG